MANSSFFAQDGYSPTVIPTFQQIVNDSIDNAGAIAPKTLTIVNPSGSNLPEVTLFYLKNAVTISRIDAVLRGTTPSVSYSLRYGPDRSAAGTEVVSGGLTCSNTNTGTTTTTFNNPTVPLGNYVWVKVTAISGLVDEFSVTLSF
jgi:hypothetical protein